MRSEVLIVHSIWDRGQAGAVQDSLQVLVKVCWTSLRDSEKVTNGLSAPPGGDID